MKIPQAFQSSSFRRNFARSRIRWFFCLALVVYLALIVLNVTTSSLSLNFSSSQVENTAEPIFSAPQPIRSDEWLRFTPERIGRTNSDWNFDHLTPFEYRSDSVKHGIGLAVYYLVFPERYVAENIGARGLAFSWWFPFFCGTFCSDSFATFVWAEVSARGFYVFFDCVIASCFMVELFAIGCDMAVCPGCILPSILQPIEFG